MELIVNRVFICVLLLSISGFISSSIYLILEKNLYKLTSAKFMVFANTVVLFSFVIPFYYLVSIMDGSEGSFIDYNLIVFEGQNAYNNVVASARNIFPHIEYIDNIWFIGVLVFIAMKILMYLYTVTRIKRTSFIIQSDVWASAFEKIMGKYTTQNVLLMGNSETTSPFTVGILHKYIVIPAIMINALDEEEIEFVLSHECYHTSQNDVGRKVLMIVLNCLNWFNPLFYFLKDNLSAWMEIACDEAVTERFDGRQKRKYAALIIKSLELENIRNKSHLYCVCYSGNNVKHYKRRIVEIMGEKKKNGLHGKVFVSALAVFSLTCSNVVAKAADIPVNMMFSNNVQVAKLGEIEEVQSNDMMIDTKIGGKDHSDLDNFVRFDVHNTKDTTYDIIYNDDIKAIYNQPQDQIKPQHAHQIVDITLKEHKKNSDGSCKTTYYEGRKCKVCGAIWKGDVIQVVTQPKCQH
ncbi:M56 family metallopeptidase [Anaerotignum sp.]|uniref:M56 family metallopeptidase n=1 Tax=Anaerotignum sp. TaxID=2039241 RepID=UPI002A7ECDCA|nr:M56 family metallopeptidase [Anaerotignum sp.]MDY3596913.1 M56 family metallopeptidase [Anaerotignum sp.]